MSSHARARAQIQRASSYKRPNRRRSRKRGEEVKRTSSFTVRPDSAANPSGFACVSMRRDSHDRKTEKERRGKRDRPRNSVKPKCIRPRKFVGRRREEGFFIASSEEAKERPRCTFSRRINPPVLYGSEIIFAGFAVEVGRND